ncbi:hypothetical protein B0A50_08315 [Salinomyces thailandicus]|uniref:Protein transport protein sec16 n=1 Tax=Salinomyces thailandicus TaxID=706561 RepID=A0A4U0TK13_9PEZI|nr:hypothetical protein B0A50_08315 [Salinomyces thailandica]
MDDEDEYPQFGNAFPPTPATSQPPNTTPAAASWNPALRRNTDADAADAPPSIQAGAPEGAAVEDEDDDFFDRYPGATPKKAQPRGPDEFTSLLGDGGAKAGLDDVFAPEADAGEDEAAPQDVEGQKAVPEDVEDQAALRDVEGLVAAPEDLAHETSLHDQEDQAALPQFSEQRGALQDEEGQVFDGPDETVQEQEHDLESYQPDVTSEATQPLEEAIQQTDHVSAQPEPDSIAPESTMMQEPHPEERYEHQGAVPEMEAAQDEEPDAPLLEDEEAPPTPGNLSRRPTMGGEETLGFDGEQSPRQPSGKAHAAAPHIDRTFTSNFTDMSEAQQESAQTASIAEESNPDDWPAAGDDRTFGDLLDDSNAPFHENTARRERPHSDQVAPADTWPSNDGNDEAFGELLNNGDSTSPEREAQQDAAAHGLGDVIAPDGSSASVPATEDDLAAAWQAALDDDDLLDEGTDPAKLFGEDDGLLEDEGSFLEEEASQQQPRQQPQHTRQTSAPSTARAYIPASARQQQPPPNPYAPNSPSFTTFQNPALGRSGGTPDTGLGLFDLYSQPVPPTNPAIQQVQQTQAPQRPGLQSSQSFADKSKGGYQSPYDLPMEVVKPLRRVRPQVAPGQQQQPGASGVQAPPPRSSSFGAGAPIGTPGMSGVPGVPGAPPSGRGPTSLGSGGDAASRPSSNAGPPPAGPPSGTASAKSTPKTGGASGFFEDLPMTTKPRTRPSGGYTPQPGTLGPQVGGVGPPPSRPGTGYAAQPGAGMTGMQQNQVAMPPPPAHPSRPPTIQPPMAQQPAPQPAAIGGLRQPERMPLLPDQPLATPQQALSPPSTIPSAAGRYSSSNAPTSTAPPATNRYSPAPNAVPAPAAAASRYSPAPPAQQQSLPPQPKRQMSSGPPGVGVNKQLPFAPRTSSPLAWSAEREKPHPPLPAEAAQHTVSSPPQLNGTAPVSTSASLSPERSASRSRYSPSETSGASQPQTGYQSGPSGPQAHAPPPQGPPRPRTQSPGATMKQPRLAGMGVERPSSAAGLSYAPAFQPVSTPQQSPQQSQVPAVSQSGGSRHVLPHRRQFSKDLAFTVPQDERAQDPLERWKGGPIFHWSAGGGVVTSFPVQTPFYAAGHGIPTLKVTAGDVKLQEANAVLPLPEKEVKFPGPLPAKSKGKKKEVLAWLSGKVEDLERENETAKLDYSLPGALRMKAEEKLVLWKMMHIFIENDGVLEGGKAGVDEMVRRILLPNLAQMSAVKDLQSPVSASTAPQTEPVDRAVLSQIRQALLEGQRDRAVWLAEEKKLWGHALLLASTLGPDSWKQTVQAFVRSQVKSAGGSEARSLAALYQIFAGNSEDCVDELVPPSARAGFQMVSRSDGSVSGNALEGLDQWRETLALVTSNRTGSDGASLIALGSLLASYGRVEAAQTCFLFARNFIKHGGADDTDAHFVLLGGDHQAQAGRPLGSDLDTILLTEIYEWALSLTAPTTAVLHLPPLQPYKLLHAQTLAAHGLKSKALSYCDHLAAAFTSTTRPSPYYHPTFTTAVAELQAFLQQAPRDGKGGLFSRPAMKTVSSGAASWFSKFVAGEDERDAPQGEGAGVPAGFGGVVPGMDPSAPGLDRGTEGGGLYNPMMGGPVGGYAPSAPSAGPYAAAGGRYAPQATPSPAFAPQQQQQHDSYMSPGSSLGVPPATVEARPSSSRSASSRYAPVMPSSSGLGSAGSLGVPRPEGLNRAASDYGDEYAGSAESSRRGSAVDARAYGYDAAPAYQPSAPPEQDAEDPFAKPADAGLMDMEPPAESGGYEPPASSYEPPSYQPYQPDPEAGADEPQPQQARKKGMMDLDDEDDEIARRAAALKQQQKSAADHQADEAFRKAAEADAVRSNSGSGQDGKKGWLSGWFGGKKDPAASADLNSNKPVRAKLGEQNSFYYDEKLKKWVNGKAGPEDSAQAAQAAATPPPPRAGPPSRVASGLAAAPPLSASSTPPLGMGPPSRPSTSASAAAAPPLHLSNPPSRITTPAQDASGVGLGLSTDLPSGPPSRPPTGLSTASSLDDLLGGGPGGGARKAGGTVKGKKKGGRYVDVMAAK